MNPEEWEEFYRPSTPLSVRVLRFGLFLTALGYVVNYLRGAVR